MTRRLLCLLPTALCVLPLAGCGSDRLETGYVYTPLGDNSVKRRGYYADPFSPEARAAQTEQTQLDPNATGAAARRGIPGQ